MRFSRLAAVFAVAFIAGCSMPFRIPGDYKEGMPPLYDSFGEGTAVWVERPGAPAAQSPHQRRVHTLIEEFEKSFEAHGSRRPEKKENADVVAEIKVLSWEYNDAGFSGFYPRDHVELSVTLSDPDTKLILQRANVRIVNDFRIIRKYVDSLYEKR